MPNMLKEIDITHISLVKKGANGKTVIYKSDDTDPSYDVALRVMKTDNEKGILYGIVYAPDQEDSQGDIANAAEIEKAAYSFMKSLNLRNVDREHDFENRDAYVAESWLVRKSDPIFPDEPEGAWAVAIKLESEELIKAAKDGDINGLSMAGTAKREPVEKMSTEAKSLVQQIAAGFDELWVEMRGRIAKSSGKKWEEVEEKDIAEVIKKSMEPMVTMFGDIQQTIDKMSERQDAMEEKLKKSGQNQTPPPPAGDENTTTKGIM